MSEETEDPKSLLRKGKAYIFIELVERIGSPSMPSLAIGNEEVLSEVRPLHRSTIIASSLAYLELVRATMTDPDSQFRLHEQDDNPYFPPLEEVVQHAERSLKKFETLWPYEAEFARSCILDHETAVMGVLPFPVPGGFQQQKQLVPSSCPGLVFRTPSPVCYFPNENVEDTVAAQQMHVMGPGGPIAVHGTGLHSMLSAFFGGTPAPDSGPDEFNFPEPPPKG